MVEIIQIVITRTGKNTFKVTAHSKTEVVYGREFDDEAVLFRHILEDLIDELKAP